MDWIELLFWAASGLVVYPYLIYPLILKSLAASRPAAVAGAAGDAATPSVTLVISAFNEVEVLDRKLENSLAIDYPAERLRVLVVSDASDDGTDAAVLAWNARDPRIELLRQAERRGKSAGLNLAMARIESDIVVFSDANAMYAADALKNLVAHFADPQVGYAVGAAHYYATGASGVKESEGLYWKLELSLKNLESRVHSVVGGDGAIYAVRRKLFWTLRDDDISDFVNPLQIVAAGYRGVFEPAAVCYEDSADAFDKEFRRKRRIVNRSWRAVRRYAGRLHPVRDLRFIFMLISHKVIRWYAMPLVLIALIANVHLVTETGSALYLATLAAIVASLGLGLAGSMAARPGKSPPRLLYLPYYFYLINLAGLLGIWDDLRGVRHATWEHVRQT